jgi:hypothetical protein
MREQTTLYFDTDLRRRLRLASAVTGRTQNAIVSDGLARELARLESSRPDVAAVLAAA